MVASLPDLRAALVAGLLLLPALTQAASPRVVDRGVTRTDEYVLDGRDLQIDTRANTMHVRDVTITQGGMRVQATEATATGENKSFDNSRWEFTGGVRIRFADGNLTADKATVTIVKNRIVRATADGAPAEFEQKLASMPRPAQGKADSINYDVPTSKIRLSGNVRFSDGRNDVTTQALVYNLSTQFAETDNAPGASDRVHMIIRPKDAPKDAAETAAPAATP